MPGVPEEQSQENFHSWKVEAEGNTYWVVIKPRRCSHALDKIKICDVTPLIWHIVPKDSRLVSLKKDIKQFIYLIDSENSFIHIAVCFNQDIVVALVTKTATKESPEHQQFIESFVFLE